MKRLFLCIIVGLLALPVVYACGERDVRLVDSLEGEPTVMKKSSCSSTFVPVNEDNVVLVEKSRIKVDQHKAQHVLEEYLLEEFNRSVVLVNDDHSDVPGHEHHHHAKGRLQDSHGTISYAFLVRGGETFYKGKAIPLYVDAEDGKVYGVGCGFGAGKAVFNPDPSQRYHNLLTGFWEWITIKVRG